MSRFSGFSRRLTFGLVSSLALSTSPAFAGAASDKLADTDLGYVEGALAELQGLSTVLQRRIAPRGMLSDAEAVSRFESAVFEHMVGNYESAAETFFSLVATTVLKNHGLHQDAEWYLAESLYEMGNVASAESAFQVISDDAAHPFREDAVRRLLELYAENRAHEKFDRLFEREIVSGGVDISPVITYSVGKAFWLKGDVPTAQDYFQDVPADTEYFGKARYYLGAILVQAGTESDLKRAADYFRQVSELPVESSQEQQLRDLALLGLGRIYYELGQYTEAATYYDRISGTSLYLDDKLYELVWTFIRQEEYQHALRATEIFLLAFPEHQFAAQLRVIRGRLHYIESEYDSALMTYESILAEYEPVLRRFRDLSKGSDEEVGEHVARIRSLRDQSYFDFSEESDLPPFVVSMLVADEELDRAVDLYADIVDQDESVTASEALIAELDLALAQEGIAASHASTRFEVMKHRVKLARQRALLLEVSEKWLSSRTGASEKARVDGLRQRRVRIGERLSDAEARLSQLDNLFQNLDAQVGADVRSRTELGAEVVALQMKLQDLLDDAGQPLAGAEDEVASVTRELGEAQQMLSERDRRGDESKALLDDFDAYSMPLLTRLNQELDEMWELHQAFQRAAGDDVVHSPLTVRMNAAASSSAAVDDQLEELQLMASDAEQTEISRIRERFAVEKEQVAGQRVELAQTYDEAEAASVALVRAGFGRMEDFFANSMLDADLGVVKVYWSRWVDNGQYRKDVAADQQRLLTELRRRFDLIRQQMGQ